MEEDLLDQMAMEAAEAARKQQELDELAAQADKEASEKSSSEPTTAKIDTRRLANQRTGSAKIDAQILDTIIQQAGEELLMNGTPVYPANALADGNNPSAILDYILEKRKVDTNIDSGTKAFGKGFGLGSTNAIGGPVDLVNAATQGLESLFRKSVNKVGGDLSTDPDDFLLSSTNPIGGGQSIRDGLEGLYSVTGLDKVFGDNAYIDDVKEIPKDFRRQGAIGRVIGENASVVLPILASARAGIGLSNPIVSQTATKAGVVTEAAATTGQAAAAATVVDSDNPWVQMGAEFVGAVLGGSVPSLPTGLKNSYGSVATFANKLATNAPDFLGGKKAATNLAIREMLMAAAKQRLLIIERADQLASDGNTAAAERLYGEAEYYTPERIQADLQAASDQAQGIVLPAGTATENPFLMAMQNTMAAGSKDFRGSVNKDVDDALEALLKASEIVAKAGNPNLASTIRDRYFQKVLETRIFEANEAAATTIQEMPNVDQATASAKASEILFEAKSNFRNMETALWDRVDRTPQIDPSKIRAAILEGGNSLPDGITIGGGGQLDEALVRFSQKDVITVDDVLKLRSRLLDESRMAASGEKPDYKKAAILDDISGVMIDELSKLPVGVDGDTLGFARAFSVALKDRFDRSFVGKAMSARPTGAQNMRPEEVLDRATGPTGITAQLNLQDLQNAATDADLFAEGVEQVLKEDEARRMASRIDGAVGTASEQPNTSVATTDEVIYPENTAYPYKAKAPFERPIRGKDGKPLFDDDGNMYTETVGEPSFRDPASGNDIFPPEGSSEQKRLDEAFDRPEGETYRINEEQPPEDEFKLREEEEIKPEDRTEVDSPRKLLSLGDEMSSAQENYLRAKLSSGEFIDPKTGLVNEAAIDQFKARNPWLAEDFPDFEVQLDAMRKATADANEVALRLGEAADTGKLPEAVGDIIKSRNPEEGFARLAEEAIDLESKNNLKFATMDYLFKNSIGVDGNPDFLRLADEISKPLSGQYTLDAAGNRVPDKSILDVMVDNNIISNADRESLGELVGEGLRLQRSQMDQAAFDQTISENPTIINNLFRIVGANIGTQFGFGSGAQLQAASIGSSFLKKFVDDAPGGKALQRLQAMFLYPQQLSIAIGKNPKAGPDAQAAAKEFILKYGNMDRSEMLATARKSLSYRVGGVAGGSTPIAATSAITQDYDENEVTDLEGQMMGLGLPDVDLPSMYPSQFLDENGNPK